ncbi:GlsB/YeaQ/YmgE family stress response membrane protein [Micromonospora avicenniae]|uniref:GlsB/YeaQ/YmgE family stress response membrane protein n=1 Tax=Micromonospora avicenniae TaxID=1198245 RepID=UPI00341E8CD4
MSGRVLVSALVVGLAVGMIGRWAVPGRRAAPLWLTLSLGVAAALLGSIVARLAGADINELPGPRLTIQAGCAAGAVLLALLTAGQRDGDHSTVPNPPDAGRRH